MTAIQIQHGPFAAAVPKHWGIDYVLTTDVSSRTDMVKKSTDVEWLKAVIRHHDTQLTVQRAAERRLRQLGNSRISDDQNKQ